MDDLFKQQSDLLFDTINGVKREIQSRDWILQGRGPYEWDDDEYRNEAGLAFEAIMELLSKAAKDGNQLWREWQANSQRSPSETPAPPSRLP